MSKIEKESQTDRQRERERQTDGWLDRETKAQSEWLIYPSEEKTLIK